jgi:hypothetical protein
VLVSHVCGNAWHVDRASAGRVLPAAFSQLELNQVLADMLTSRARSEWTKNGLAYAAGPAFHSMAASAVDTIEHLSVDESDELLPGGEASLYVSAELAESLQSPGYFDDLWSTSGDIYRRGPGRRTLKFSAGGKDYFLKAHSGVGWREILKNLLYLRLPVVGARNEWDGIHRLRQLGIDTLSPSAYGTRGRNPATRKSLIITQALPPAVTLEDYCADWGGGPASGERLRVKRWLIVRLAHIARTLHCSGANHRDFYLCHFMMSLPEEGGRAQLEAGHIYLIDLHRMQLRRNTPSRWVVKDIAGLYFSAMDAGLTARDCYRFLKHYSGGRCLRETLRDDSSFWRSVENRAIRMYRRQQKGSTDSADPVVPGAL